jgi:4,5-DOPA dioxygenase extradiol
MKRSTFLKMMATIPAAGLLGRMSELEKLSAGFSATDLMPALFIGHGHPMNALFDNDFTRSLSKIAGSIEKPNAIMVVSAHWETRGTFVSVNPQPKTIHDFGNFDDRLFQIKYEPKGHPEAARDAIASAAGFNIMEDAGMGLDHGAWTVLRHIYPAADIPVFQLSVDYTKPPSYHYELGSALRKLRRKGVLVVGSGNIVHNLGILDWQNINARPFDWALEFDEVVKARLGEKDFQPLVDYRSLGRLAQMAIPTSDHYLPMLYTLGLAEPSESVRYLFEGFQYGSVSMRCFLVQ